MALQVLDIFVNSCACTTISCNRSQYKGKACIIISRDPALVSFCVGQWMDDSFDTFKPRQVASRVRFVNGIRRLNI